MVRTDDDVWHDVLVLAESTGWTRIEIDLASFLGRVVEVGLFLAPDGAATDAARWHVRNVEVQVSRRR
jgi:hypothetical protein